MKRKHNDEIKSGRHILKCKNPRRWFLLIVQLLLIIVMIILIWKIGSYLADADRSRDFFKDLGESVIIMEKPQEDETASKQENTENSTENGTENRAEMEIPAAIDFDRLYEVSEDAVAWLYAPNGAINYVVAQAEDNDYYLHRLLNGEETNGGTLFADFRNSAGFSDWNTVIYGHNMKNGTMFASLLDYRNPDYYEEHPAMYLYTPGHRYRLELIAGYTTNVSDLIYSVPATKEERDEILEHAYKVSSFVSGIIAGAEDKLVTLSTCSYDYDDARYVVIGRLVEE